MAAESAAQAGAKAADATERVILVHAVDAAIRRVEELVAAHAGHVEKALERVGRSKELGKGCLKMKK